MTGIEIILLIIGVCVCAAGFMIPHKKDTTSAQVQTVSKEEIQELLESQLGDIKIQIDEMAEETISYSVEKTERAMERLTNEKIAAVTEYADTVLKDINKNHKEVMFLYDMLTEKHDSLLETVKEVEQATTEIKQSTSGAERIRKQTKADKEQTKEPGKAVEQRTEQKKTRTAKKTVKEKEHVEKDKAKELLSKPEQFNIQFASSQDGDNVHNNNDKILALYKEGKSNTAIAKELGLGVGEVKLVIDLFKGMSS
jgi:hypothetical protein